MKKLVAILLSTMFALTLTACETTKGVGKDIQNAGEKLEQAVSK
ncbi:entericidin A/B family lipoprotein [Pasteurella canis]|uniref:Putative entericidin protein n=1 Tax=Pasteurella canis TaxID=753 RepID=A0A379EUR7_9PAST|nr:entericidin A/B family lipoprotein [Pasteurella canis]MXN89046.1 entericidin A/B family lipoprotein [Pasteurella canis]UAX41288.1 entericidin A/B family lipoprotein [Pasteurella canis]UAY78660.1 entericidin A/B family lipoprotein [Pasteurella canis]UDW82823.1 entericidin A/B family lipoprotein [Pasteurella canis]UEA15937.1 entericidin A/B family lipoprotein [Pasteurella canis]